MLGGSAENERLGAKGVHKRAYPVLIKVYYGQKCERIAVDAVGLDGAPHIVLGEDEVCNGAEIKERRVRMKELLQ